MRVSECVCDVSKGVCVRDVCVCVICVLWWVNVSVCVWWVNVCVCGGVMCDVLSSSSLLHGFVCLLFFLIFYR